MQSSPLERQVASRLLMIRPPHFGPNAETAPSNAFQSSISGASSAELHAQALREFDGLARLLRERGVEVCVIDDDSDRATPDALFPNNWVSFHADGTVVLYPMMAPNRRLERRPGYIVWLAGELGVTAGAPVMLFREHEPRGAFLEGTGSLILDRPRRVAYACISPRTHPAVLADFARQLGYEVHAFHATDDAGQAIYHTNVLMTLGEGFCVLCLEALADADESTALVQRIEASGRDLIAITRAQMCEFAGNLLQVENAAGERFIVGSTRAFASLEAAQTATLERHGTLLAAPLDTIETIGGGGARCMLAEVFLPSVGSA